MIAGGLLLGSTRELRVLHPQCCPPPSRRHGIGQRCSRQHACSLSERSLVSSDARNARIVCSRYAFENFHVGASVSRCCSSAISSPSARSRACAPSRSCRNCSSSRCFLCSNSTTICAETFASVLGCGWITRRGCAVRAGFTLGGGLPSITAKNPPTPPFFLFVTSYTFLSLRFCCQAALSFRLVEP